MIDSRHVRIATEGALLGSLIAHGVSPELTVLSDGAGQFDVFVHALCWLHVERPLERLVPHNEKHRLAIEQIRQGIWELYAGLKAYRKAPDPMACDALGKQFDDLVAQRTDYPSIDGVLKAMASDRAKLLLVLERPEVPLHNNLSEGHIRDYVKKRKISGSTRSELGRRARDTFASLKKTCRRLGVNFWEYLQDRVRELGQIPQLSDQIRQRAEETAARNVPAAVCHMARVARWLERRIESSVLWSSRYLCALKDSRVTLPGVIEKLRFPRWNFGIDRVPQHVPQRRQRRPAATPTGRVAARGAAGCPGGCRLRTRSWNRAQRVPSSVELVEDQPHDRTGLLVRVQGHLAGGQLDVPERDVGEQLAALGLVNPTAIGGGSASYRARNSLMVPLSPRRSLSLESLGS